MRSDPKNDAQRGAVKSSGKWRVDVNFTAAMADEFMANIESEKVRDISIFESRPDERNNLRKALQAAKTSDDRMKAIARFVGEGGFQGESMNVMRQQLFGQQSSGMDNRFLGNFDYDLMLPGDKNFRGVQGRLELEHKLAGYQALMTNETSSAPLVGSLNNELDGLRKQRAEIADLKKYTDLPDELRAQQVQKLDAYIETVRGMRQSAALAATKLNPDKGLDANEAAKMDEEVATAQAGGGDPKLAQLRQLRSKISSSDYFIDLFKFQGDTARSELGQLGQQGEAIDRVRDHKRQYDQVHAHTKGALEMKQAADAQLRAVEDLRVQFILSMNKPDQAMALGNLLLAQLKISETLLEQSADRFQQERDLFAGDMPLQEEKPVFRTLQTDEGPVYFDSPEQWNEYLKNPKRKPGHKAS
jgi:hypothetical protein